MAIRCRLCLSDVAPKHSTALFSEMGLQQDWPSRLRELLLLPVSSGDGLPSHICRSCTGKVETVERKLKVLRQQARKSAEEMQARASDSRKRPKDTSSETGVSPATAKARPPAKRKYARQLFPSLSGESSIVLCHPLVELDVNSSAATQAPTLSTTPNSTVIDSSTIPKKLVTVTVETPSRAVPFHTQLDASLTRVGRALAGGNLQAIAKAVFNSDGLREQLLQKFTDALNDEATELCRKRANPPSLFRRIPLEKVPDFEWCECINELKSKAPILLQVVSALVSCNDSRNKQKCGNAHNPGISMAIAILLKERNREMCGVQTLISLVLFTSRVQKQVYTRLNHVNASISYTATIEAVNTISKQYKIPINLWVREGVEFKFVGDNVDKKKVVRDIRADCRGEMKHMFSILAVRSRVPSHIAICDPQLDLDGLSSSMVLPTIQDVQKIRKNLVILVSRILCRYMKSLSSFSSLVPAHIPHKHSKEMACKSETRVLDVLSKNEATHSDMLDIMKTLQSYLGEEFPPNKKVVSGGDQLTCEREANARRHMMDGDTPRDRLALLEPVCEDWHALMCFLCVIWKTLYRTSSRDHGTLGHFCSLLGRLPRAKDPKKDFDACLDALFTVLKGHFVAAACSEMDITSPSENPEALLAVNSSSPERQQDYIYGIAKAVVTKCSLVEEAILLEKIPNVGDHVNNYTRVLCHFGSLALEFSDAWAEGDGERICRCWRVFLLHFRMNGNTKYAWEALRLQLQLLSLPPELSSQIKWNRFVNTHGGLGRNIPCDLHNEHINKLFKEIITNMGANLTDEAMQRAARSVTTLRQIRDNFDKQSGVPVGTSAHSTRPDDNDVVRVASVVIRDDILGVKPGRSHSRFPKITANPLSRLNKEKLLAWIEKKVKETVKYREPQGEGNLSDSEVSDNEETINDYQHLSTDEQLGEHSDGDDNEDPSSND